MGRKDAFSRVKQERIIPAIRVFEADKGIRAVEAIHRGGIPIVEVSMFHPGALKVVEEIARSSDKEILVGAGTVVDAEGLRRAVSAGANFIVTPGFDLNVVEAAAKLDVAIFAGALTPTEVHVASTSGADAVKLFPCYATGGPRYLRSLSSQYPRLEIIASGGIGLNDCEEYFRAGACAIGVGGEIADAESMARGDYRVFTVRAKRFKEAIQSAFPRIES